VLFDTPKNKETSGKVALEEEWADKYRRGEKYNALISAMVHNVKHFYDYLLWHFEKSGRNVIFYSIISGVAGPRRSGRETPVARNANEESLTCCLCFGHLQSFDHGC
jgi:hypothetical protein